MKVYALIFAGGTGSRMTNAGKPKQFLELYGKPIIIHTLEHFETHPEVEQVVVVCVSGWLDYLEALLAKFHITKVKAIVPGGETGQMSIYQGLTALEKLGADGQDLIIIHDGVRPLIDETTISDNIQCALKHGTAITTKPVIETVIQVDEQDQIVNVIERSSCQTAAAPQTYTFETILSLHHQAQAEGRYDMTDSSTLAGYYGIPLHTVMGTSENIKITTPSDVFMFKAIYEGRQEAQIFG